jgi:hypothetical protein
MTSSPLLKSQLRAAGLALLLTGLLACRINNPAPVTFDALADKYVALVVELGEHDSDSLDFYFGSDPAIDKLKHKPETLENLHRNALTLHDQMSLLPENSSADITRKTFLVGQIDAIILRTDQLMGKNRSFDEESRTFFGVIAPQDNDAEQRKVLRTQIAALLGNTANPAEVYARYDSQFIVPAVRVPAVMDAALQQCRTLTLQHITLPPGEQVDVEYMTHKPWSAFSRYLGNAHSLIQVNMDYPLTIDRILDLACHEGYPGHHVFNSLRDLSLVSGMQRDEFRVQLTFSPQSYVSEAAASYAPSLVLSDVERLHIERDLLFPLAGIKRNDAERYLQVQKLVAGLHTAEPSIAREYIDDRLEFVRAADALEQETLMQHAETTLLYLNEYRTYRLCYTVGNDSVRSLIENGQPTDAVRWQRYLSLMMNPVVSVPGAAR